MVAILAYPKPLVEKTKDVVLTFVVPSHEGCNLNCSYCYIKQRNEVLDRHPTLLPNDYAKFISGIAERRKIGCISLQGEEPLLPESMPYTKAILSISQKLNIPTAIVTNGTHLATVTKTLARYKNLEELTVSLDAADAKTHDKLRGRNGAFKLAINGIKKSMSIVSLSKIVSVNSVLFPGNTERLIGIPELLQELGIHQWFVTPAIKIGDNYFGGPVSSWDELMLDLELLYNMSSKYGINMIVEDEYDYYRKYRQKSPPTIPLRFRNLDHPEGVLRLLPDGTCEAGHELLRKYRREAPRWIPGIEHPDSFYTMVMSCFREVNNSIR